MTVYTHFLTPYILAPNYKNSYNRLSRESVSREWLLDLLIHLRFSRNEIQQVLERAYILPLSDDPDDPEYYIREEAGRQIGSAVWYRQLEMRKNTAFIPHYAVFKSMEIKDRLILLMMITCYVYRHTEEMPPVDYILESLALYDRFGSLTAGFTGFIRNLDNESENISDRILDYFGRAAGKWEEYLGSEDDCFEAAEKNVYEAYRREFREYYHYNNRSVTLGLTGGKSLEEAERLRFLAALTYTVFTGRYFAGQLTNRDLENIEDQFAGECDGENIYSFISKILGIFLSGLPIFEEKSSDNNRTEFYVKIEGKSHKYKLDLIDILENLYLWVDGLLHPDK